MGLYGFYVNRLMVVKLGPNKHIGFWGPLDLNPQQERGRWRAAPQLHHSPGGANPSLSCSFLLTSQLRSFFHNPVLKGHNNNQQPELQKEYDYR